MSTNGVLAVSLTLQGICSAGSHYRYPWLDYVLFCLVECICLLYHEKLSTPSVLLHNQLRIQKEKKYSYTPFAVQSLHSCSLVEFSLSSLHEIELAEFILLCMAIVSFTLHGIMEIQIELNSCIVLNGLASSKIIKYPCQLSQQQINSCFMLGLFSSYR